MIIIRCVDVETTGLPPDAAVCELGYCDLHAGADGAWKVGQPVSALVNPGSPMPPAASAVHHITDDDLTDAPTLDGAIAITGFIRPDIIVYAAHRASFEQQFLNIPGAKWICSWKVAIRLAPKAPGHGNQTLRYWLKLAVDRNMAAPAHRAGPDAYVTAHLMARMLVKMSVETMIEVSTEPALLPYLTFGAHAKKPIEDVPTSYFEWMVRQETMDEDARFTARHYLNLRSRQ